MTRPEPWLPSWNGPLYAAHDAHHRVYDARFLDALPLRDARRILDIGCGAGDFTKSVADRAPAAEVVGVDPQPSMLEEARRRAAPNQSFVCGTAQALAALLPEENAFDVVMSRAVLHWVPLADHLPLLTTVHRLLRPGGWLRLEMGGAGNIPKVQPVLDSCSAGLGGPVAPWTFLDAGTYADLLEAAGFSLGREGGHVRTVAQRRPFDENSLRGWLESQAYQAYLHTLPRDRHTAFRAAAEARLDEMRRADRTFDQTYVRLEVLLQKL